MTASTNMSTCAGMDALICNTSCLSVSTNSNLGFCSDHIVVACFAAFMSNSLSVPCTLGSMAYSMVWGEMLRKLADSVLNTNANATTNAAATTNPIQIAKCFRLNVILSAMQLPFKVQRGLDMSRTGCMGSSVKSCTRMRRDWATGLKPPAPFHPYCGSKGRPAEGHRLIPFSFSRRPFHFTPCSRSPNFC